MRSPAKGPRFETELSFRGASLNLLHEQFSPETPAWAHLSALRVRSADAPVGAPQRETPRQKNRALNARLV
jgi:hypothetical protein